MDVPAAPAVMPSVSAQLRMILRGMLAVLGLWRLEAWQALLVHRRLHVAFRTIEALLARHRAGFVWGAVRLAAEPERVRLQDARVGCGAMECRAARAMTEGVAQSEFS